MDFYQDYTLSKSTIYLLYMTCISTVQYSVVWSTKNELWFTNQT